MNNNKPMKKKRRSGFVPKDKTDTMHLQVQLIRVDALQFKYQVGMHKLTIQEGLVQAINLQMKEWGYPPFDDPSTVRQKK